MAFAPLRQRADDGAEVVALRREDVLRARRMVAVIPARDDALPLEQPEPVGEDAARDPFDRVAQVAEAALATKEIADDEQRPAVPDQVECRGDGTADISLSLWRVLPYWL